MALLPCSKGARWLGTLLGGADAVALLSPTFTRPDGSRAGMPFACLLVAHGRRYVRAVARVALADKYIRGAYHVRPEINQAV